MRITVHLDNDLGERVREDAKQLGQSLAVWFSRAAEAHLATTKLALQPAPKADRPVKRQRRKP